MKQLSGKDRARYVQEMFSRIAPRYDMMNRIMTAGQDTGWRKEVIARARLPHGGKLLDLGTGTGDLTREALRQDPTCTPIAADFTLEMMRLGKERQKDTPNGRQIEWTAADGGQLPFPSNTFDAVVSGFLLRNVIDVPLCIKEQWRVLKPGGAIVALDTTPPPENLITPFIRFYLRVGIPVLGQLLASDGEAYTYLPNTTEHFLAPERLAVRLVDAGFQRVHFRRLMFGTIAIYWGQK